MNNVKLKDGYFIDEFFDFFDLLDGKYWEYRVTELEKKKVKILTDIRNEIVYMNKSRPRDDRECLAMAAEEVDSEVSESILKEAT